jgi:diguanylate cyclase (GGDEF)-like protein/PAS domain S-box-containing protein
MIVEDEGATAIVIQRSLEEMGYTITSVETTAEGAVKKVSIDKPDMVLMDISLGGEMDGIEAAEQIHSGSNIPIVYITAHSDEKIVQRIMKTEPFGYIIKPFDERDLRIAVEIALYKHGLETKLRESENKFRNLVESTSDWVWEINADGLYVYSSPKVKDILGYDVNDVLGKSPFYFMPEDEARKIRALFKEILSHQKPFYGLENINRHKDGHIVVLETSGVPVFNKSGNFKGYRGIDRDITKRKKMEEHLKTISMTDELTGIFNRRGFFTLTEKEFKLSNRHKRRMSLIYMDLDGLKAINDELGHEAGDQALVDAANILRKSFRESDIIGRIGGDEFAVLITDSSEPDVEKIVTSHIGQNIEAYNKQTERSFKLSLSKGFAHYEPDSPCTISDLIKQADSSMYEDKKRHNF